jgi:RimK family alpha-L-glutamate ligase
MKKGLILTNPYTKLDSELFQSQRLKEEFNFLGVDIDIKRNSLYSNTVKTNVVTDIKGYDFIIYLDKDKYNSAMLEKCGYRLFNSCEAVQTCDDKMLTHLALANSGILMPETLPAPLCYTSDAQVTDTECEAVISKLGLPVIVKECQGSLGREVYKADNKEQLKELMQKLICKLHLYQQFISSSAGTDTRVIVVGAKVIAAMQRVSQNGDFRSNISTGGKGFRVNLKKSFEEISIKAADILKLDYCGIDLLTDENGEPILCEVNSNAFFGGIEKITGVNVAKAYAEYIYKEIYLNR